MMRPALQIILLALALIFSSTAHAQTFDTKARAAFVYDVTTDTVLMAKNADDPLPPASMSKLMTLFMAFEAITEGRLRVDEELTVSQHAMDYGGSSMFLRAGERISVEDLLRGIIVLSGNDASAVIAEALSPDGTEGGFAQLMTDRARQLGMTNSTFVNSNGWPAAGHRMSVRDLGILANRLITDFPTFYPLFAQEEFAFDGRVPSNSRNRNPVLSMNIGADGLKTGHTQEAGYGLVGSAKQGDRRVIWVITGLDSAADRAVESERIVTWAFRQFAERGMVRAGTELARADVWMGLLPNVGLTVEEDVHLLIPVIGENAVSAEVVYDAPISAPIRKGQQLGELVITLEGLPETRVPLVAEESVAEGGFAIRLRTAAQVILNKIAPQQPATGADGA